MINDHLRTPQPSLFIQTGIPAPMLLTGPDKKIKIAQFTLKFTFSFHRDKLRQNRRYTSIFEFIKKSEARHFLEVMRHLTQIENWMIYGLFLMKCVCLIHRLWHPMKSMSLACSRHTFFNTWSDRSRKNLQNAINWKTAIAISCRALFGRERPPGRGLGRHNSHYLLMVWGGFSSRETEDRETTHYTDKINYELSGKERI